MSAKDMINCFNSNWWGFFVSISCVYIYIYIRIIYTYKHVNANILLAVLPSFTCDAYV